MGFAFHQLCPRYSGFLTPTSPVAVRLLEAFTYVKNSALFFAEKNRRSFCSAKASHYFSAKNITIMDFVSTVRLIFFAKNI